MNSLLFVLDLGALTCAAVRLAGPRSKEVRRSQHALVVATLVVFILQFVLTSLGALLQLRAPIVCGTLATIALVAFLVTRSRLNAGGGQDDKTDPESPAHWYALAPLGIPIVAVAPYLLRAIVAPPRAWDALTYHLVRGVQWIVDGGFISHPVPDAARYYDFFPHAGDLQFAFVFLSGHGDALLYLVYGTTFALILLATYAFTRTIGAPRLEAALATAAVGTLPCVLHQVASAYVDDFSLALTMASMAHSAVAVRAREADRPLALALVSAGLGCAVKMSAWPTFLAVAALAAVLVWRRRASLVHQLGASAVALLPAGVWLIHTYADTGSPTYPFGVNFWGIDWTEGNELLRRTLDGTIYGGIRDAGSLIGFAKTLFLGAPWTGQLPLHFGIGAALLLPFALLTPAWNRRVPPAFFALLLIVVLVPVLGILSPSVVTLRTIWGFVSARLIVTSVAIPICLVATLPPRFARTVLGLSLLLALPTMRPIGILLEEITGHASGIAAGSLFAVALIAPFAWGRRGTGLMILTTALFLGSPVLLNRLDTERDGARQAFYAATEGDRSFDLHGIDVGDSPVAWRFFDDGRPHTIAFSTGFEAPGQDWFRYPLFGRRFQNGVVYVPATRSGDVVDTWRPSEPTDSPLDADAYADRLALAGVTEIMFAGPHPPEFALVVARPDRFEQLTSPTGQSFVLYRLRRPDPKP